MSKSLVIAFDKNVSAKKVVTTAEIELGNR